MHSPRTRVDRSKKPSGWAGAPGRPREVLGEQALHAAGLTGHDEIGTLRERAAELEQQLLDRHHELQDRDDELAAARAANRDLMATLNGRPQPPRAQHL